MNRIILALSLAQISVVHAHHSHFVDFEPNTRAELRGTFERVYWANPHIRWDVVTEDGEEWQLHVQANASEAPRSGMTRDTFAPGDEFVAVGEIGRDGRKWLYVNYMRDDDGDEYGSLDEDIGGVSFSGGADLSADDPQTWTIDDNYVAPYRGAWRLVFEAPAPAPTQARGGPPQPIGAARPSLFDFEIIEHEGQQILQARGGIEDLHVDAAGIKFTLKVATGPGVPYEIRATGNLNGDGSMAGTYISSAVNGEYAWTGGRQGPEDEIQWASTPFRLDGTFGGRGSIVPYASFLKTAYSMTDAGRARYEQFDPTDALSPRCQPMGPLQELTFGIHKFEFIHRENQLLRIRQHWLYNSWFEESLPDDLEPSPSRNGFSVASWEKDHLKIETTHLRPGLVGLLGYPYSGDASVVERIWLSADGSTMRHTLTLHDPRFYHFPIEKEIWRTRVDTPQYNVDVCDPDAFYIDLYNRGAFDDYIERTDLRP